VLGDIEGHLKNMAKMSFRWDIKLTGFLLPSQRKAWVATLSDGNNNFYCKQALFSAVFTLDL